MDLYSLFLKNQGRVIHKWKHYFPIYERHFSRFRGTSCIMLEIGIWNEDSILERKPLLPLGKVRQGANGNKRDPRRVVQDSFGVQITM